MIKLRVSPKKHRAQFHCNASLLGICLAVLLPLTAQAQAPVVDDSDNFAFIEEQQAAIQSPSEQKYAFNAEAPIQYQDDERPLAIDDGNNKNPGDDAPVSLEDKVRVLQKELQELRGQLEVQAHELAQLKQQQLSFYKDIDARMQSGKPGMKPEANVIISPPKTPAAPFVTSPKTAVEPGISNAPTGIPGKQGTYIKPTGSAYAGMSEQKQYTSAYELVKNKQYDKALGAMQDFVKMHPKGNYTANAHYWLGELYMVKNNQTKAIEQFAIVINQFPDSGKLAASHLKMGYALAASGRTVEAKQRLQKVVNDYPGTTAAQLAAVKLDALQLS